MQMRLELIPLPVSDVDGAIAFYADKLGFKKDVDVQPSEGVRVVQLTPEGSGCSIGFGTGLDVYAGEPSSVRDLHLVVEDITEARAELVRRGVEIGEIQDFGGGVKGADFSDPDGQSRSGERSFVVGEAHAHGLHHERSAVSMTPNSTGGKARSIAICEARSSNLPFSLYSSRTRPGSSTVIR